MPKAFTLPDGRVLHGGPFTLGDFQYPPNWLELATADDLAARNITVEEVPEPEPHPTSFPELTQRQFRLAMLNLGITAAMVDAAIAAIEDPVQREVATIEWQWAGSFRRDHPLVAQLSAGLLAGVGKTESDMDAAWLQAPLVWP